MSSSAGEHRIFPNVAVNHCDDLAIGYTKTSADIYPGVFVSGRRSADPAGTLQPELLAQPGDLPYAAFDKAPHRWGDYTGMTIDPDGTTFWYLGQYSADSGNPNGRWATHIRAMTFPDCNAGGGEPAIDLSTRKDGRIGTLNFQAADILHYENGAWSLLFDASDTPLARNVTAFYREDRTGAPDILYLTLATAQTFAGIGQVAPHDVLKFTPTQLGPTTQGTFSLYFDGSDVGLTTTNERIDALGMDGNRLLISTVGSGSVPRTGGALGFADEDVIAFTPTSTGATTAGDWALYFDGSAAVRGLGAEDVSGFWDDPNSGDLYISLVDAFNLGGVTGAGRHILRLSPTGAGTYTPSIAWDGAAAGLGVLLDAFELAP